MCALRPEYGEIEHHDQGDWHPPNSYDWPAGCSPYRAASPPPPVAKPENRAAPIHEKAAVRSSWSSAKAILGLPVSWTQGALRAPSAHQADATRQAFAPPPPGGRWPAEGDPTAGEA